MENDNAVEQKMLPLNEIQNLIGDRVAVQVERKVSFIEGINKKRITQSFILKPRSTVVLIGTGEEINKIVRIGDTVILTGIDEQSVNNIDMFFTGANDEDDTIEYGIAILYPHNILMVLKKEI
jgi:hypothetical protein